MTVANNILVNVPTLAKSQLVALQNFGCFIHESNTKFKDFQTRPAQLGGTIQYNLPTRFVTKQGLVADFQGVDQRFATLTVDQALNTSYDFTATQQVFNIREYMDGFGMDAIEELGTVIEAQVATNADTKPYRFYGDGYTELSSFNQVAKMLQQFRTFGCGKKTLKVFLSDVANAEIVGSGLNQFVIDRNEEIANSWVVGSFSNANFFQSNLLTTHNSGTVGNERLILTVTGTNDPTGNNITQIYCSGANVSDANSIALYDKMEFIDNVGSLPNMRFRTFVGHIPSSAPVQMSAQAPAGSDGSGNVVLNINPPLCITPGNNIQNIVYNVVAGMQIKVLPSHRCGLIVASDALFLAMPRLPDQFPFASSVQQDPTTGVSLRLSYGADLINSTMGYINSTIWGSDLKSEYGMTIIHPL